MYGVNFIKYGNDPNHEGKKREEISIRNVSYKCKFNIFDMKILSVVM